MVIFAAYGIAEGGASYADHATLVPMRVGFRSGGTKRALSCEQNTAAFVFSGNGASKTPRFYQGWVEGRPAVIDRRGLFAR